jgi:hypothetical protein
MDTKAMIAHESISADQYKKFSKELVEDMQCSATRL